MLRDLLELKGQGRAHETPGSTPSTKNKAVAAT